MINLKIRIEINGKMVHVGNITGNDYRDSCFKYDDTYCESPGNVGISISLPLQKESFSPTQTRTFFEGLLPEGFTRRAVASELRRDENDYLAILVSLGKECIGAIEVSNGYDNISEPSYLPFSKEDLLDLANEGATKAAEIIIDSRLSLAGASGKIGIYIDEKTGKWYLPKGNAPGTHIIKQSHIRLKNIVANEAECMEKARNCGIDVPDFFTVKPDDTEKDNFLFVIKRFDRIISHDAPIINNLKKPFRLHQEDFGQALGINPNMKYEPDSGEYLKDMFGLLQKYSLNPIEDSVKLLKMIIFNVIVGNTDCHVKNFSLLYTPDLKTVRLSPAYDIVDTTQYEGLSDEFAFNIGGRRKLKDIDREAFRCCAKNTGISEKMVLKIYDDMQSNAAELCSAGFKV